VDREYKLYSMLGLAQKGKNIVSGIEGCKNAVQEGKAKLIILTEDCAKNTLKLFNNKCNYRNIPVIIFGSKECLGRAIGKEIRSVVAVMDNGIANAFVSLHEELINNSTNFSGGDMNG